MRYLMGLVVGCALSQLVAASAVQAGAREDCEQQEDRDLQISACSEIIRGDREAAWAYRRRGAAYLLRGEYDRAIADFSEAIKINPSIRGAYSWRGYAHNAKGDYDLAIADLSAAIKLSPDGDRVSIYPERGYAYAAKGDFDRAMADCNEAIERMGSRSALAYVCRGKAHHGKGEYERAIADYTEAIKGAPQYPLAHFSRGKTFEAKGDRDRAIQDYNKAIALPAKTKLHKDAQLSASQRLAVLQAQPSTSVTVAPDQTGIPIGRRVALVIGNAGYKVGPLANPVNDATAVAEALEKQLKFDKVTLKLDLGRESFLAALTSFSREAAGAGVALVYYAGHATERRGKNFLIPIDARLDKAGDLGVETILLDTVLEQIEGATKLKLVILDSCRNSMFPLADGDRRGGSRGLIRVEPGRNTLVAYAAKDGTVAADGVGSRHSPFTEALLKRIATPGLELRFLFGHVRDDVLAATAHQKEPQEPYLYGSLGGEQIFLRP